MTVFLSDYITDIALLPAAALSMLDIIQKLLFASIRHKNMGKKVQVEKY